MHKSRETGKRGRPKKSYSTTVIRVHSKLKALLENDAEGNHRDISDIASVIIAQKYGRADVIKQVEADKQ